MTKHFTFASPRQTGACDKINWFKRLTESLKVPLEPAADDGEGLEVPIERVVAEEEEAVARLAARPLSPRHHVQGWLKGRLFVVLVINPDSKTI